MPSSIRCLRWVDLFCNRVLWRVTVETGYRVELARNGRPGETILVPAAWNTDASTLLAWDVSAGANGQPPTLYRVNVAAHDLEPIEGYSLAQGTRLAWPVGPQDTLLLARQDNLITLPLGAEDTGLRASDGHPLAAGARMGD